MPKSIEEVKQTLRNLQARRYLKRNPWMRNLGFMRNRCAINPMYNGVRKLRLPLINKDEIKKLWFRDKAYNLKTPSLDRIDNDGHYTYGNCRFIERSKNRDPARFNKKSKETKEKIAKAKSAISKEYCKNGHKRTDENTAFYVGNKGKRCRQCRICLNFRRRERRRLKKIRDTYAEKR